MIEHTRAHERLPDAPPAGRRFTLDAGLPRAVTLFVPAGLDAAAAPDLLVHFHGAAFVAEHAVAAAPHYVLLTVHLGAGSGVYERAFADPRAFDALLRAAATALTDSAGVGGATRRIVVSAFSAGHGAVRALLRGSAGHRVAAALLLDGIHSAYQPPGVVLAEGGTLDTSALAPFVALARRAARGDVAVLITHSEIFPGTFASTTETTDHIIGELGARRSAILAWGPVGMQQLSEFRCGRLAILGFAGNSAPDHIDHLHGLPAFLRGLDAMSAQSPDSCTERDPLAGCR